MKPAHRPFIEQCIADFGLQFRSEPGLSIIIPFPRVRRGSAGDDDDDGAGLNRAELLDAVIRNYFYPIISGRLEVVVDAGSGANVAVVVNGDTIDRVMAELDLPETGEWSLPCYRRLFAMCRASRSAAMDYETLPAPPSANRSGYDAALLDGWRARYQAGEMLAFRIGAYGMEPQRRPVLRQLEGRRPPHQGGSQRARQPAGADGSAHRRSAERRLCRHFLLGWRQRTQRRPAHSRG